MMSIENWKPVGGVWQHYDIGALLLSKFWSDYKTTCRTFSFQLNHRTCGTGTCPDRHFSAWHCCARSSVPTVCVSYPFFRSVRSFFFRLCAVISFSKCTCDIVLRSPVNAARACVTCVNAVGPETDRQI